MLERIAEPMLTAREALWREFAKLHREVLAIVKEDQVCRRLMTVPGVGALVSLTYRAGVDDPAHFAKSKSVGAFFGLTPKRYQSGETDVTGAITKVGDAGVRTALHDAANALLTRASKFSTLKRWALDVAKRRACGERGWRWHASWPRCCIEFGRTGRSSSGARIQPWQPRHSAKETFGSERGQRGSAPMRSRRRDAEMVRQVPLQWPGAIPRLRPVDCSTPPSYSMKWRSRADHGQKHETGGWIHSELDDQGPITEAAEPKVHFSPLDVLWPPLPTLGGLSTRPLRAMSSGCAVVPHSRACRSARPASAGCCRR